ncbi:HPF/RaiA family ribosome-associated protein [Psychroserpens luteolus]|uniref:HPF/RaiA family ribosome-associated protein n=1 Tax=Psychroserpens luteolus TaxID=2855840 RepID=UPI001E567A1F|nr:HPF/RaiA family ribosome-associated protein [Psychroserpens luteolus]MCD2260818.1 HPF/RaiA family ribosome-associated protein [Psychroserpens luteolus]
MNVMIRYVGVDRSETLNEFTEEKLNKLSDRYEFIVGATVRFKQDDNDHTKGKICDIELSLPGPRIFATSNEAQYEVAVRETISDLVRQLKKRKEVYKTY